MEKLIKEKFFGLHHNPFVILLIRKKYSYKEESNIINNKEENTEAYKEYQQYVELCESKFKEIIEKKRSQQNNK